MIIPLITFFLGAIGASFTQVIASRVYTGISPFKGRSHCFSCGKSLTAQELIPIVSYFLGKGRCKHCGTRISVLHPLIEVITGTMCAGIVVLHGISFLSLLYIAFIFLMVFLVAYDIAHTVLPTAPLYGSLALGGVIALLSPASVFITLIGALVITGFFYALYFFSRGRAMGFGDVILSASLSLAVGIPALWVGLLLSFWLGAVISIAVLYVRYGTIRMKGVVPFGPFLVLGFLGAYIFEAPLLSLIAYIF